MDKEQRKILNLLPYASFILSAAITFYYLFNIAKYSVNVPNSDDFDLYLDYINEHLRLSSISEKFALLFQPHNEHYPVFPRLLALGLFMVTGEVNFVWLNILGCLVLLVYLYVVWTSVHIPNFPRVLLLLCICLMIFHPQYIEATLWATAAISNLWVIGFALLSFQYAQRSGPYGFLLAFLFGAMATLTLGNGVFVFLILGLIFLANRQRGNGVLFLAVFGVFLYMLQANSAEQVATGANRDFLRFALNSLDYCLTFLGSSLSLYSHAMGLSSGIVFMSVFFLLVYLRYDRKNPVIFGLLLFCILTAVAQSLVRSQINPDFSFTTIRYKIVSIFAFSGLFIGLVESLSKPKMQLLLLYAGAFVSAGICLSSYHYNFLGFVFRKQFLEDSLSRWNTVGAALEHQVPAQADRIMRTSINLGIYQGLRSVKTLDLSTVNVLSSEPRESSNVIVSLENINVNDDFLFIRGWAFLFNEVSKGTTTHIVLMGASKQYILSSSMRLRLDVTMHHKIYFNQGNLDQSGFQTLVMKKNIQPGEYDIGLVIKQGKSIFYKRTASKITL